MYDLLTEIFCAIGLGLCAIFCAWGCVQYVREKLRERREKKKPIPNHSPEFLADRFIVLNHSIASSRQDMFAPMPDDVREAWQRCVDAIIEGREQADESELLSLKMEMSPFAVFNISPRSVLNISSLFMQGNWENKDEERFARLSAIYDQVRKQNTKLKVKCPGCRCSLKGINEAMIGYTTVCPKCKAEFTIENKSNKARDKQEK